MFAKNSNLNQSNRKFVSKPIVEKLEVGDEQNMLPKKNSLPI